MDALASNPEMDWTGQQLSHYRLTDKLGEGGMGSVYRAEDVRLGRTIALKLLPQHTVDDAEVRERFLTEAQAIAALEHPHICLLYEFEDRGEQPFLAMQFVDGGTLKQEIERGTLEERRAQAVLTAMASALGAAHQRGIVHRDVKSDNILVGRDGVIKLADFGIARLSHATDDGQSEGVAGTIQYMAPEQVQGEEAGPAADQFALGVVLYECLTGRLPFDGEAAPMITYAIMNSEPAVPSSLHPGLSPHWDAMLARALQKDPAERFPSVLDMARAITESAADGDGAALGRAAAAVVEAPREPAVGSVAVLPFQNLSKDEDSDYFCEGISEDIRTDLSKVPGIQMASSHAVARYRGSTADVRDIAAELGVRSVVSGKVRRAGDRVRINVDLTDAITGFQSWAERFDRTLDDVFAVQEEIASAVVTAIRGALTPSEAAELKRAKPAQVEAYDLYLRGRDRYRRYTREDNLAALESFERAAEVDPGYALAWAGIADCCGQMIDKRWDKDSAAWIERGYEAARRAVALDPKLAEGHKAEALIWRTKRDRARSVEALRRALDANPVFIPALINLAQEYLCDGDFAGAERALRRAIDADPAYGFNFIMIAVVNLYTYRYEDAVVACHRAQSTGESPFFVDHAYALRAHALADAGDLGAAWREVVGGRAAGASRAMLDAAEALIAARAGDPELAGVMLDRLAIDPPLAAYGCELSAAAAARIGRAPLAITFLEAAERIDARHIAYWRISPDLKIVRDTPEFVAFLADRGRMMVWPAEAPPLAPEERGQFLVFREASGIPKSNETP
jgi:serine/threonine protein kinase/tetratricopeptide (TPR) repeat protein